MTHFTSRFAIWFAAALMGCTGAIEPSGQSSPEAPGGLGPPGEARGAGNPPATEAPPGNVTPTTPLVRRLTRYEIVYTLKDVLGVELTEAEREALPADRLIEGFVNIATSQGVTTGHVEGYAAVARGVAARFDVAGFAAGAAPCLDTTPACGASFVKAMGLRLFRRPPDDQEVKDFVGLFGTAADEGQDFPGSARVVIEAMLQSPQFLYRLERETSGATGLAAGKSRLIGGYEMASRLSYFLWSSAPDDTLYEAARAGTLDKAAGVAAQVERMLKDNARSLRATERFITDLSRVENLSDDDDGLLDDLVSSLFAFYQDLVWMRQEPLFDLFTTERAFLTPDLARHYGVASAGDGVRAYDLSAIPGRIGLLTQPGFLAGMTETDGEAMVARGLFLQAQVHCAQPPPAPPNLQETIDAALKEKPVNATDRQTADLRLARPECAACHAQFDPLAFALERFDHRGSYREKNAQGGQLRADGWIPESLSPGGQKQPYDTVEDYARLVGASPEVRACFVKQNLEFALGRHVELPLEVIDRELVRPFVQRGGSYADLVALLIQHPLFSQLQVE